MAGSVMNAPQNSFRQFGQYVTITKHELERPYLYYNSSIVTNAIQRLIEEGYLEETKEATNQKNSTQGPPNDWKSRVKSGCLDTHGQQPTHSQLRDDRRATRSQSPAFYSGDQSSTPHWKAQERNSTSPHPTYGRRSPCISYSDAGGKSPQLSYHDLRGKSPCVSRHDVRVKSTYSNVAGRSPRSGTLRRPRDTMKDMTQEPLVMYPTSPRFASSPARTPVPLHYDDDYTPHTPRFDQSPRPREQSPAPRYDRSSTPHYETMIREKQGRTSRSSNSYAATGNRTPTYSTGSRTPIYSVDAYKRFSADSSPKQFSESDQQQAEREKDSAMRAAGERRQDYNQFRGRGRGRGQAGGSGPPRGRRIPVRGRGHRRSRAPSDSFEPKKPRVERSQKENVEDTDRARRRSYSRSESESP